MQAMTADLLENPLVQRVLMAKMKTQQHRQSLKREDAQQKSLRLERAGIPISKCPYGVCDGNGVILNSANENESASICKCVQDRVNKARYINANIPERFKMFTVNSFDCSLYDKKNDAILACNAKEAAIAYLTHFEENAERGEGLYLHSHTKGSGKTRLAISIGNAIMASYGKDVKFVRCLDLLSKVKESYREDSEYSEYQILEEICNIPVLILDEIGVGNASDSDNKILTRIIENRGTNKKITILTSNCDIDELPYDERIISKLKEQARRIKMPEESVRDKVAEQRDRDFGKQVSLLG